MSALTEFRPGDTRYDLVAKSLRKIGGTPRPDDTEATLWRKVVELFGGMSKPADSIFDSLLKIKTALDPENLCTCGDSIYLLLRAIVLFLGGTPRPSDTEYDLIRRMLGETEENCLLLSDGTELLLSDGTCLLLIAS
jgi:hypothetical protein